MTPVHDRAPGIGEGSRAPCHEPPASDGSAPPDRARAGPWPVGLSYPGSGNADHGRIALAIWRALPRFRRVSRCVFFRIAHNRAIAHLARRRPLVEADEGLNVETRTDPERAFDAQQEQQLGPFSAFLAYAQVVTLTLEGLSYAEVAGCWASATMSARLTRAQEMLLRR